MKFTKRGHISIKVHYDYADSELVVHVADTGRGIAQEDLPKLFTRFGKLQRTAALNHDGIGLGLNISKQIVEQASGKIGAYSDGLGHGSVFFFSMKMDQVIEDDDEE